MDKNSKLIDFLQYDTTLGREQNIVIGKVTSLCDTEGLDVKPGVKLTQFLPQKRLGGSGGGVVVDDSEAEVGADSNRPKLQGFEERMR